MRQIVERWVRGAGLGMRAVSGAWLAVALWAIAAMPSRAEDAPGPRYFYTYLEPNTQRKVQIPLTLDTTRIAVFRDPAVVRAGGQRPALGPALAQFGIDEAGVTPRGIPGWWSAPIGAAARDALEVEALVARIATAGRAVADFVSPVLNDEHGPVIVTRDVLVAFRAEVTEPGAVAIIEQIGIGQILDRHFGGLPGVYRVRAESRDGFELLRQVNTVATREDVRYAEPDFVKTASTHLVPNDPFFPSQWGLNNTGQSGGTSDVDVNAPAAWDTTTGSTSVIVLVMDDGIDLTHPDLAANILAADDFTGTSGDGSHFTICEGHGTGVSGIIAARFNNNLGVSGVAPSCRLVSAKVIVVNSCFGPFNQLQPTWIVSAIDFGRSLGARISNTSLGFGQSNIVDDAFTNARNAGMVHFASAGNDFGDPIGYPASSPSVNSVSAITRTGALASFSNVGSAMDFCGPGVDVYTTDWQGGDGYDPTDFNSGFGGTSSASPFVAGVAALIASANPLLLPFQIEEIMQDTAKDLGTSGRDPMFGFGLPDALAAINAPPPPAPSPGLFGIISPSAGQTDVSVTPTFTWGTSTDAASYDLLIAGDMQLTQTVFTTSTTDTTFTMSDALSFATTYFVRVTARNTAGATNSTIREFTTAAAAPTDVPGSFNLLIPFSGATGVSVAPFFSWSASDGAASYLIEVDDSGAFDSPEIAVMLSSTSYLHVDDPLAFATTYFWRVTAGNVFGPTNSTPSPASFTTESLPPLEPPGFFALQTPTAGQPGVALSPLFIWEESEEADTYNLQVDDDSGFGSPEIDTDVLDNFYVHTGTPLAEATRYFWRVTATNTVDSAAGRPDPASFQTTSGLLLRIFLDSAEVLSGDTIEFGEVNKGSTQARTFRIQNIGLAPVNVGKPKTGGKGFSPKGNAVRRLLPGQFAQFQAKLSTSKPGDFVGTFEFTRSDDPTAPFRINLLATVLPPTPQARLATGNQPVSDGDSLDVGSTLVGTPKTIFFNINNPGTAALKLGSLTLESLVFAGQSRSTGARGGGSGFSVLTQPGKTVNPGKTTQFKIKMDALAEGMAGALVVLPTNDPLFPEFTFDLLGEVDLPGPAVGVQVGTSIVPNGGSANVGMVQGGIKKAFPIVVRNTGTATLNLGAISSSVAAYAVTIQPNSSIPKGGSSTGFLTVDGNGGISSSMLSFNSNDPDDSPFTFTINANIVPAPDMEIRQGATLVVDGSSIQFGAIAAGVAGEKIYTINNLGTAPLILGVLSIQSPGTGVFNIKLPSPSNTTVQPGFSTTFTLRALAGIPNQIFTDTVNIPNNDPDENPYNFMVTTSTTGVPPVLILGQQPSPTVSWPGGSLPSGSHADFGATTLGHPVTAALTLANGGDASLEILAVSLQGSGFSLVPPIPQAVGPEESAPILVRLDADQAGSAAVVLTIRSNAPSSAGEYTVLLSGRVSAE